MGFCFQIKGFKLKVVRGFYFVCGARLLKVPRLLKI